MNAYRDGDKARFRELDAEADALRELHKNRVKPHWEKEETDQTEGEYFAALELDQRREYLAKLGVVLYRDKAIVGGRERKDPWL